jgi:hypothetical protein
MYLVVLLVAVEADVVSLKAVIVVSADVVDVVDCETVVVVPVSLGLAGESGVQEERNNIKKSDKIFFIPFLPLEL